MPVVTGMNLFSEQANPSLTILEHIRAHLDPSGCGLLPGGDKLPRTVEPEDTELAWAPGAWEGVLSHHVSAGQPQITPDELISLIGATIAHDFRPTDFGRLYERIRGVNVLSYVDEGLAAIRASALPPAGVHELAWRLATEGRDVDPVKFGIALFNLFAGTPEIRDLLLTLGRSEELTLYCAVAIANTEEDPDPVLWTLARSVDGWGRIHTVERLRETQHPEIQDWLLRDGFRNAVMNEYLAYTAAVSGRLLDRLRDDPDDELLDSACEIVSALIAGGPAQDIDDYADAPELLAVLLGLIDRGEPRLVRFVVVDDIRQFLDDEGWDSRYEDEWTPEQWVELSSLCTGIRQDPRWGEVAESQLDTVEPQEFWKAERAARVLGIDTLPAYLRRLESDPLQGNWYAVMQLADSSRIGQIVDLAERVLPLDHVATGPGESVGMTPEFAADMALGFILQELGRFPGHGWALVRAALRSRVIRSRALAITTLERWPREVWPAEAVAAVEEAARIEPVEQTRAIMYALLRGS